MAKSKAIGLVVGLGNPGENYSDTRHNAGFWFVDRAAEMLGVQFRSEAKFKADVARANVGGRSIHLLRPATYMNESGASVAPFAAYYKIDAGAILVAHDELELTAGTIRQKTGGGHGGHNGLRDIAKHMGAGFARLRIGIDRPRHASDVAKYVLNKPTREDREAIDAAIDGVLANFEQLVAGTGNK